MVDRGWRGPRLVVSADNASNSAIRRVDALIDAHFDFVWRQLRRQGLAAPDADDAAQEVFVIAARKIAIIEVGQERSFLYGTALRVARNVRRSQRRRTAASASVQTPEPPAPNPESAVEAERARALLDELLAKLPDELRRVLVLAEVEELSAPRIPWRAFPSGPSRPACDARDSGFANSSRPPRTATRSEARHETRGARPHRVRPLRRGARRVPGARGAPGGPQAST